MYGKHIFIHLFLGIILSIIFSKTISVSSDIFFSFLLNNMNKLYDFFTKNSIYN